MTPLRERSGAFELFGFRRYDRPGGAALTVYLEGDGLAWNAFGTAPSPDPTPRDPVALRLAAEDGAANRLYLARVCQYQTAAALARCSDAYWTSHRFAEEVVAATADVVRRESVAAGATHIRLVGYSGGGALAALVAPRLSRPVELVTIAAPLDHAYWTKVMGVSPMYGSLNPAEIVTRLAPVPQVHIVSTRDDVVPEAVVARFVDAVDAAGGSARLIRTNKSDHWCCWPEAWPQLLAELGPG